MRSGTHDAVPTLHRWMFQSESLSWAPTANSPSSPRAAITATDSFGAKTAVRTKSGLPLNRNGGLRSRRAIDTSFEYAARLAVARTSGVELHHGRRPRQSAGRNITTRWSERGTDKVPASITQQRVAQRGRYVPFAQSTRLWQDCWHRGG